MKLRHISIQNFKGIGTREKPFTLDFSDDFDHVREMTVIVGPNGSGKTSILDAVWFPLMDIIGFNVQRETFRVEPQFVVTTGERYATVELQIEISEQERKLINIWRKELFERGEINNRFELTKTAAHIIWTYPSQPDFQDARNGFGGYRYDNQNQYDWAVLQGKTYARRLKRINATPLQDADDVGGVYFFEQERHIITKQFTDIETKMDDSTDDEDNLRRTLINLGLRDRVSNTHNGQSWYQIIRNGYNYICGPRQMGEVYATDSFGEYQVEFRDQSDQLYTFDGLSSGERSVLYFLTRYVFRRMKNSIVLIDEPEVHLHPTWQRLLIQYLRQIDSGNQFILTTHSPTVMQAVYADELIELGTLDENLPSWQYASLDKE